VTFLVERLADLRQHVEVVYTTPPLMAVSK
jgi:hypothetical protein